MSPLYIPPAPSAERYQAQILPGGVLAENYPRQTATAGTIMVSGTVYYLTIGLRAGDPITNLLTFVSAGGSGFSGVGVKLGLYTKANVQLGVTGDVSGSFGAAGPKVGALTTPASISITDAYLLAIIGIATTMPTLYRTIGTPAANTAFSPATLPLVGAQTGQTDLPTTPVVASSNSIEYWCGVS